LPFIEYLFCVHKLSFRNLHHRYHSNCGFPQVEVVALQADLATGEGIESLSEKVTALGRNLDIACINAGVGVGGLFVETGLDPQLNMVELNCAGTVHLAEHVVPHMTRQGDGKILFTASIAGEMVAPREPSLPQSRCSHQVRACTNSLSALSAQNRSTPKSSWSPRKLAWQPSFTLSWGICFSCSWCTS
jgi:NADP-dependent 3-hydroxy acid dehydrogenase YdfG